MQEPAEASVVGMVGELTGGKRASCCKCGRDPAGRVGGSVYVFIWVRQLWLANAPQKRRHCAEGICAAFAVVKVRSSAAAARARWCANNSRPTTFRHAHSQARRSGEPPILTPAVSVSVRRAVRRTVRPRSARITPHECEGMSTRTWAARNAEGACAIYTELN